jgi:riboflavin biosynthesis pyrimidine reductase
VRALLPGVDNDVDLVAAYATPRDGGSAGRPFVRANMISSLDGAVTVDGRSGQLGGPADRRVFGVLRSLADVIVVGAGTARAEGYGPVRLDDGRRRERVARGQRPVPPIAVVTRSASLEWSSPFFAEAEARPIVLTTASGAETARARGHGQVDAVVAGDDRVDPRLALAYLSDAGFGSVLLEGGPGLNAEFVHAGLLDELCLSLAPRLVAGDGPRVLAGPELPAPLDLEIAHLLEEDGFLFYRLTVPRSPSPPRGEATLAAR